MFIPCGHGDFFIVVSKRLQHLPSHFDISIFALKLSILFIREVGSIRVECVEMHQALPCMTRHTLFWGCFSVHSHLVKHTRWYVRHFILAYFSVEILTLA